MSKSTIEYTIHADQRGKIQQMDAEFDGGLLVQNSQPHPTFAFE